MVTSSNVSDCTISDLIKLQLRLGNQYIYIGKGNPSATYLIPLVCPA